MLPMIIPYVSHFSSHIIATFPGFPYPFFSTCQMRFVRFCQLVLRLLLARPLLGATCATKTRKLSRIPKKRKTKSPICQDKRNQQ
jgi:hypothetical protein